MAPQEDGVVIGRSNGRFDVRELNYVDIDRAHLLNVSNYILSIILYFIYPSISHHYVIYGL